jgi:hypothetical protein
MNYECQVNNNNLCLRLCLCLRLRLHLHLRLCLLLFVLGSCLFVFDNLIAFLGKGGGSTMSTAQQGASDTKSEVRRILCDIPSASTYGATNLKGGWKRNKELSPLVSSHRCNSGTPVVLLDPVLSELYDDVVNKIYVPTAHDCKAVKELMAMLSEGFHDEDRMQSIIKNWAVNLGNNHPVL